MTERVDVRMGIRSLIDQLHLNPTWTPGQLRSLLITDLEQIHYLITRTDPFL